MIREDMICKRCGSVLSAVTFECVRGDNCCAPDRTPRYAPDRVMIVKGGKFGMVPVTEYKAHPPGKHPAKCPLVPDCDGLGMCYGVWIALVRV